LAIEIADLPDEYDEKKKLWLKIAKHVVTVNNNFQEAIKFLKITDIIKLEDVLPFFPDFVEIDNFKDEVIKSLKEYKDEIDSLQSQMQEATQNANFIREDIKELKHRYGYINKNANCTSDNCKKSVIQTEFYIFPCQHMFHTNCLIYEIKKFPLDDNTFDVKKITTTFQERLNLLKQLKQTDQSNNNNFNILQQNYNEKSKLLDDLISKECPLCGIININSIDKSFYDVNNKDNENE
jgi:hypothetical protein